MLLVGNMSISSQMASAHILFVARRHLVDIQNTLVALIDWPICNVKGVFHEIWQLAIYHYYLFGCMKIYP